MESFLVFWLAAVVVFLFFSSRFRAFFLTHRQLNSALLVICVFGPMVMFTSSGAMILKFYSVMWTLQSFLFIQLLVQFLKLIFFSLTKRLEKLSTY